MAVDTIEVPVDSFEARSADGLRIRAHRSGRGPHRWLLPPAVGTPVLVWKHVFERFHDRMTMVTWDQRGTYGSDSPPDRGGLDFVRHVDDAFAVLDAVGWNDGFVTGSWSMGAQVGLEVLAQAPGRVKALTLINGAYEHVLRTAYGPPWTAPLLRGALRSMLVLRPLLEPPTRALFGSGTVALLMDTFGVTTSNRSFVTAITRALARVDYSNYVNILLALDAHSSRDAVARVDVPTLITAGTKDVATPMEVVRDLHRRIPNSRLVVIPNGTHYTPLEYPEALNDALEDFFRTVAFPGEWG